MHRCSNNSLVPTTATRHSKLYTARASVKVTGGSTPLAETWRRVWGNISRPKFSNYFFKKKISILPPKISDDLFFNLICLPVSHVNFFVGGGKVYCQTGRGTMAEFATSRSPTGGSQFFRATLVCCSLSTHYHRDIWHIITGV